MKHFYISCFMLLVCSILNSQIVNFPGPAFKAKLLESSASNDIAENQLGSRMKIDANDNGEIEASEALLVYRLNIHGSEIDDVTGISAFANLEVLSINSTGVVSIEINLPNLIELNCAQNQLTSVNFIAAPNLESFSCAENMIPVLDVSGLTNLEILNCSHNLLQTLNVSGLSALTFLHAENNQFTTLNISGLENLKVIDCMESGISSINLADLPSLTYLDCSTNLLTALTVNQLPTLEYVVCHYNQLTTLDLSELKNLELVGCSNNPLIHLNIKNGSGEEEIQMTGIPTLQFVCIDEADLENVQYVVQQEGLTNCSVSTYCSFVPGGDYGIIEINTKADFNLNGCGTDDMGATHLKLNITDGATIGSFFTDENGIGRLPVANGSYTITPDLPYYTIGPGIVNVSFPGDLSPAVFNLCVTPTTPQKDVEVTIIPTVPARPGFDATYTISYRNTGNQIVSGNVILVYEDSLLDYSSSTIPFSNQLPNTLVWDYTNLYPFQTVEIAVVFNVNSPVETPAVNIGDQLNFSATVHPVDTDVTPLNNVFGFKQTVVGSFDPNDKTCLEGVVVSPEIIDNYVNYLIRFENTGTFPAENIVVADLIDPDKFNIGSLYPVASSHPMVTRINSQKVEFIFENINLPFDDANNDGYVAFKIKTLPTLVEGDNFANSANIYFDYNFPVVTNTATTTIELLGTSEFDFSNEFKLYPNPTAGRLNLESLSDTNIKSAHVYNALGQLVMTLVDPETGIDVFHLQSGAYFLKVTTEGGSGVTTFIKK